MKENGMRGAIQQFQSWLEKQLKNANTSSGDPVQNYVTDNQKFASTGDTAAAGRKIDGDKGEEAMKRWQDEHGFFGPAEPGRKS